MSVCWDKVVWKQWSLSRHNFGLWLAIIGKSSIFFGGVGDDTKRVILLQTGFTEGTFSFKYLGVSLSPHRLLASQYHPLLFKLESCIHSCLGKQLSYAGRLVLIKSVMHGMVQLWINIFLIPSIVISKITSLCQNFLWSWNSLSNKSVFVAWKNVWCLWMKGA